MLDPQITARNARTCLFYLNICQDGALASDDSPDLYLDAVRSVFWVHLDPLSHSAELDGAVLLAAEAAADEAHPPTAEGPLFFQSRCDV